MRIVEEMEAQAGPQEQYFIQLLTERVIMSDTIPTSTIEQIISGRRTIYAFKPSPVPPTDIILQGIEVARWAPNHRLTEPWHFYLLGPETIHSVIQLNTDIGTKKHGAEEALKKQERWSAMPGWLVLTTDRSSDPVRVQEDYAACCCAAQNLMLFLWELGVGVKWTTGNIIREPGFYDLLWIDPEAESVVGIFWYGYPEVIPVTERKPLQQIIIELP